MILLLVIYRLVSFPRGISFPSSKEMKNRSFNVLRPMDCLFFSYYSVNVVQEEEEACNSKTLCGLFFLTFLGNR